MAQVQYANVYLVGDVYPGDPPLLFYFWGYDDGDVVTASATPFYPRAGQVGIIAAEPEIQLEVRLVWQSQNDGTHRVFTYVTNVSPGGHDPCRAMNIQWAVIKP